MKKYRIANLDSNLNQSDMINKTETFIKLKLMISNCHV